MSGAPKSPARVDHALRDAPSVLSDAASLAPLPASEAVGRTVGVDRASLVSADPRWRTAGLAALVALVAAASLPLATVLLTRLL
ncbi:MULTISPECIES: hypothetical protein [unclassified Microbacterium]|uniref:hypothetical protein n=1 Tax=unclassified Microbacterium TaxID=2609290 RepID=UPI00342CFC2E